MTRWKYLNVYVNGELHTTQEILEGDKVEVKIEEHTRSLDKVITHPTLSLSSIQSEKTIWTQNLEGEE